MPELVDQIRGLGGLSGGSTPTPISAPARTNAGE